MRWQSFQSNSQGQVGAEMGDVFRRSRTASATAARNLTVPNSGRAGAGAFDDEALVNEARAGSHVAFEALVQRYERQIYAFTYRMMGNPDDAFDLTQECFIRAYMNLGRTNPELNFSAWLHRIASNACLDVLRRRKRIRWQAWDTGKHERYFETGPADDPERVALAGENSHDVQHVLERMIPRNRLALVLREYEGLSTREIGEVMGLSGSAVKSVLFRGREEFRRIYTEMYGDAPLN